MEWKNFNLLTEAEDIEITDKNLYSLERYLDKIWRGLGIEFVFADHFFDRLKHPRNNPPIKLKELGNLFIKMYKRYGKALLNSGIKDDEIEGILSDVSTDINCPFALKWDRRNQEFDLLITTVMRKKNFRNKNPWEKHYKVEEKTMKEDQKKLNRSFGVSDSLVDSISQIMQSSHEQYRVEEKEKYGEKKPSRFDLDIARTLKEDTTEKKSDEIEEAEYNKDAVDKAIASSNRAGRRIGGKEGRAIHALLKCRSSNDKETLDKMYTRAHTTNNTQKNDHSWAMKKYSEDKKIDDTDIGPDETDDQMDELSPDLKANYRAKAKTRLSQLNKSIPAEKRSANLQKSFGSRDSTAQQDLANTNARINSMSKERTRRKRGLSLAKEDQSPAENMKNYVYEMLTQRAEKKNLTESQNSAVINMLVKEMEKAYEPFRNKELPFKYQQRMDMIMKKAPQEALKILAGKDIPIVSAEARKRLGLKEAVDWKKFAPSEAEKEALKAFAGLFQVLPSGKNKIQQIIDSYKQYPLSSIFK